MNRAAMFVGLVLLILGLAVVHFSLANAQPGLSSVLDHNGSPEAHTPTPFPTPQPEGSISPRSGSVGGTITVRGNNFGPGETVRIFFDSQQIGTERADSDGSFSTRIDVPALPADRYRVEIRGLITRSFTFTISSSFSVTPSSGPPGSSVTVRASGFNPSSQVDITMDGDILITASADGQGKILTTVDIPSNTSGGSKSIGITGPSGSDQATFKVTAILSVAQSQASPGDVVSVSGTGFKSGESGISVTFGGTRVASGISADSQGLWSTTFDVPNASAGTHTIKASGSSTSAGDVSQASIILVKAGALSVSITRSATTLMRIGLAIPVTAAFSKPVSGFAVEDVSVTNGGVSNFAGSGRDYAFDVTPNAIGKVTVDIAAGAATDAGGNGNAAAGQLALGIPYDDDGNGAIGKSEVVTAINDYLFGEGDEAISKSDVITLINLYLFG